jgi:hypothetical protein
MMSVYQMESSGLLDILEQSVAQMRDADELEQLSGLQAGRMVLTELRRRVVDSHNIAGNPSGAIDEPPQIPRNRRLEALHGQLGVTDDTPAPVRATVETLMDLVDVGILPFRDQALLSNHARIAATLVNAQRDPEGDHGILDEALQRAKTLPAPYDEQWMNVLHGQPVSVIEALTSTEERYINMRRESPFG